VARKNCDKFITPTVRVIVRYLKFYSQEILSYENDRAQLNFTLIDIFLWI